MARILVIDPNSSEAVTAAIDRAVARLQVLGWPGNHGGGPTSGPSPPSGGPIHELWLDPKIWSGGPGADGCRHMANQAVALGRSMTA